MCQNLNRETLGFDLFINIDRMKLLWDILNKDITAYYYDDLYWFNLYISHITDAKEQEKLYKKINKEFWWNMQIKATNWKMICAKWDYLIVLKDINNSRTLTHELIHIVFDLFTSRWIEIRLENDEVFAYYYSYLYSIVREKIIEKFLD